MPKCRQEVIPVHTPLSHQYDLKMVVQSQGGQKKLNIREMSIMTNIRMNIDQ